MQNMHAPFLLSARRPVHRRAFLRLAQLWRVLDNNKQVTKQSLVFGLVRYTHTYTYIKMLKDILSNMVT